MPFLLTGATLTYWMSRTDVNLTTIGLFALVGTPYAFKFVWAPLVDQMPLPLLDRWLGRRRSWMLLAQVGILVSVVLLAWSDPARTPWFTAAAAVLVAFFSATQDIAVDAYRIEILRDEEQGAGSATTQLGYRIALWIVDAMSLLLPSLLPWPVVISLIALLIVIGMVTRALRRGTARSSGRRIGSTRGLGQAGGGPSIRRVPGLSRLVRHPAVRAALQIRRCAGRHHGAAVLQPDGLLRARDLRRHQELRRRRDHLRRPGRRHRRGALRPVQGAAGRRHPAGDHQPPVLVGRRSSRTISSC